MKTPKRILFLIVFAQFSGTSLWFAGNAIAPDLQQEWGLSQNLLSFITSSVQLGFIFGTLCFAVFSLSDKYSPRLLFLLSAIMGATLNISILIIPKNIEWLLTARFLTGFCLAGIYPIGMKIATGWFKNGLGNALGFLVGALVLGTAFPHLLKSMKQNFEWQNVIVFVSGLALFGGILLYVFVPDGPYLKAGTKFQFSSVIQTFRIELFKNAAWGYFGHMWELYTFWAFVPLFLKAYELQTHQIINSSFWSFVIIGSGSLSCILGGRISKKIGSAKVALFSLLVSGFCCAAFPLFFDLPKIIFLSFMILWGLFVVSDSPQLSTLTASSSPANLVGTSLTIVSGIGFSITIISLEMVNWFSQYLKVRYLPFLLIIGPVIGFINLKDYLRKKNN